MIKAAKESGAYGVKFQLFNDETIKDSPLKEQLHKLILSEENVKELSQYAKSKGLAFILTPMFLDAVAVANAYADMIKIRFKDNTNQMLVEKAMGTGKPVLISVPRAPIPSQDSEVSQMVTMHNPRVYPMYCLASYPPEPEDFSLEAATCTKGFSSHFPHTLFDIAFAINRCYDDVFIEKHVMFRAEEREHISFTPIDYAVSISFQQLKDFTKQLQLLERMKRVRI
jgi:sialic acid synthase SpsE